MTLKPRHSARRSTWFTILSLLGIPLNVFCGLVEYVVWSEGSVLEETYENVVAGMPGVVAFFAGVVAIALTVGAYALSLDPHRQKRPGFRMYLVLFSFAVFVAGYMLGGSKAILPDNLVAFIMAGVLALLAPAAFVYLERYIGLGSANLAQRIYEADYPLLALWLAQTGLAFSPGNHQGEMFYALALTDHDRTEKARPYLEEAYERGERSSDLLQALALVYDAAGEKDLAIDRLEELYASNHAQKTLQKIIRLILETGNKQRAIERMQQIPAEERRNWQDQMSDLMFAVGDFEGLRRMCEEFELEGAPYTRARACYTRLVNANPADADAMEALANLHRKLNHTDELVELLEKLSILRPTQGEYHRELIEYYRESVRLEDVIRHLRELVGSGAANFEEKLQLLREMFDLAEYEQVERLLEEHPELAAHPEGMFARATIFSEIGQVEQALQLANLALAHNPEEEVQRSLGTLKARLEEQKLQSETAELGRRVSANPDDMELRMKYIEKLAEGHSFDKIVELFEDMLLRKPETHDAVFAEIDRILALYGRSTRLLGYLADLHLREQNWDRVHAIYGDMAREALQPDPVLHEGAAKVLRENPHHVPSLLTMSRLAFHRGDAERAVDFLERYYKAGGERIEELSMREFEALVKLGFVDRALKLGNELLALRPDDVLLHIKQAELCASVEDYASCLRWLEKAKSLSPDDREVRVLIKQFDERRKQLRLEELRRQAEAAPKDPRIFEEMGDIHHDFTQLNEAIVAYQKATLAAPDQNVARAKLSYVLARKGMYQESEEALAPMQLTIDQPVEEQNKLKALIYNSAMIMEEDDQPDRALHLYKRIFSVDAGYREIVSRIEHLQRLTAPKRPPQFRK